MIIGSKASADNSSRCHGGSLKSEGPYLEQLTHRLAECPPEFLQTPMAAGQGQVDLTAIACDLIRDLGGKVPTGEWANRFGAKLKSVSPTESNRLRLILLACWILSDQWFRGKPQLGLVIPQVLAEGFDELAPVIKAESFVLSPDRREEFCRLCLALLSYRPAGESESHALDQLSALSSVERSKVVAEARRAHARAEEVRKAMAKKAAEEAAAKATRE